jgi:MFS family permease
MTSLLSPPAGTHQPVHITSRSGWSRTTWILLVVLCGALFLDGLDISMVGVALPSIGAELGMDASALQWIVSGYVLGYGGLLLLGGRVSDLVGRRQVFLVAVAVFGLASLGSAAMSDPGLLIGLRFVKGVAAAFTVPSGLSIITTTFAEGPARSRALSIYTVCGASGFSLGLVFGGILTEVGWRATMLLPGPLALGVLAAGWFVIPRARRAPLQLRHFAVTGALTSTAALLLLVWAVVRAPQVGWTSATTLGAFGASVLLAVVFLVTERRHTHPLVRLGIVRSLHIAHANVIGFVMFGSYAAFQFVVTLYLQDVLGWSPMAMALGFLPAGVLVAVSATKMDAVMERFGTTRLIAVGMAAFVAGYLLFLRADAGMAYAAFLLPTIVLLGIGFALCFPSVNSQATAGVADHEQGLASGLVNTSVQVGGAVTLAVVSAILGSAHGTAASGTLPGMDQAVALVSTLTAVGFVATLAVVVRGRVDTARVLRSAQQACTHAALAQDGSAPVR